MGNTTITLKTETRDRLKKEGVKGESWNDLVNRILDERERMNENNE